MRVSIGDVRLFADIDGAKLVPDGAMTREKPTLCRMHGGPGFNHATFKTFFPRLGDAVQLVYYDHRGNGLSDRGNKAEWTLAQWADDFHVLCAALEIEQPILFGQSFGDMVAQAYALRYPGALSKLILSTSTAGRMRFDRALDVFEKLGGAEARARAAGYFDALGPETWEPFIETCMPLYTCTSDSALTKLPIINQNVLHHFVALNGEIRSYDFLAELSQITSPTLALASERYSITLFADAEEIVAALPPELVRFERFADCGHGVQRDDPDRTEQVLRAFILS